MTSTQKPLWQSKKWWANIADNILAAVIAIVAISNLSAEDNYQTIIAKILIALGTYLSSNRVTETYISRQADLDAMSDQMTLNKEYNAT